MKFVEIREGLSVKKDCIEALEKTEDGNCRVITQGNTFDSTFPYESLRALLGMPDIEEKLSGGEVLKKLDEIKQNQQVFVG
jgi:hypothetical protein